MRQLQPIGLGPVAAFLLATAIATQTFAQDKPLLLFGKINPQSSWGSIVGFSTDGTHLIARGDDQAVRLWNLESLQCDMELESSYDNDRSTCLSHDGRYLVTPMPTERILRKLGLYDLRDGSLLWEKDVGQKTYVSFSPDSQLLTFLDDDNRGFIQLREVDSDVRIGLLHHDLPLQFTPRFSFSPNGRFLAVPGRRNDLKVFDLFQGGQPKTVTLPGRNMSMGSAAFIDERSILIGSQLFDQGKGTSLLQIWDAASGTMSHELEQFALTSGRDGSVAVSSDRSHCITQHNDHLAVWELASRTKLRDLPFASHGNMEGEVSNFAISPDNSTVAANQGNGLLMWDATSGASILPAEHKHTGDVTCLAISPDDSVLVSAGRDGAVYAWDAHSGVQLRKLLQTDVDVQHVAFLKEGSEVLIAGEVFNRDNQLRITGFVEIVRVADASRVKRWDLAGRSYGAGVSDDGQWLAMGLGPEKGMSGGGMYGDGNTPQISPELQIWNLQTMTPAGKLTSFSPDSTTAVYFSHDASQVWMCAQHGLYHWQRGNARPSSQPISTTEIGQRNISNELQSCYPVETAFDVPSENLFVSFLMSSRMGGDPNYVSCWSTRDSKSVWDKRFDDADSVPRKLELSPDRRLLAIGLIGKASIASPQVMLVDASSGRELHTCATSKRRGTSLCFSRDGQRIFVGSVAGDITMWDVSPAYLGLGE